MAKLTFILTLFLISFSLATISAAIPDDDVVNPNLSTKPTLLLPSQNQEPEDLSNVGFAEILPENTEVEVTEIQEHVDRPMKIVRFHPINRHFPASRLGSLRVPLHRCRHSKPRQFSFGDDMVAAGENGDFDPMVYNHGDLDRMDHKNDDFDRMAHKNGDFDWMAHKNGDFDPMVHKNGDFDQMVHKNGDFDPIVHTVRQIPERWIRIHRHHRLCHHHHDKEMLRLPMGKHHDFFANHKFREEREEMHGREERHDWGLMKSVRRFLNSRF